MFIGPVSLSILLLLLLHSANLAAHLDNIVSTIRQVLATVFPVARSPFVAATLVDILNDALERSFQANIEG